ncbi:MAG: bactofilin family protein [Bacillota bacterium]
MLQLEEGSVIFLAMVVTTVLLTLGVTSANMLTNEIQIASYNEQQVKALYLAEAGVEYAKTKLDDSSAWQSNTDGKLQLKSTVKPTASEIDWDQIIIRRQDNDNNKIVIESTSNYQDTNKTVRATYKLSVSSFNYALATSPEKSGNISLEDDVEIEGDIHTPGKITLKDDIEITGDLYAQKNINCNDDIEITGNLYSKSDITLEDDIEVTGDIYARGKVTLKDGVDVEGSIYAQDDVELKDDIEVSGTIKTTADITTEDDIEIEGETSSSEDSDIDNLIDDKLDTAAQSNISLDLIDLIDTLKAKQDLESIEYVNQNLKIDNEDRSFKDVLVVDGKLTIDSEIDIDEDLIIIARDNIVIDEQLDMNGLLYSGNLVKINEQLDINGGILAENQIKKKSGASVDITFDNSFLDFFSDKEIGAFDFYYQLIDWQELD